jgi:pimeloyl-ACP methyl ester carboxylesterase
MTVLTLTLAAIVAVLLCLAALAGFAAIIARRVEQVLPPRGKFMEIDGARIHYLDEGQGQPIVMIHGLGGQGRNFSHSLLSRLSGQFRVIVVDRPGSGHSSRPDGMPARLRTQASVIAQLMQQLQLEPAILVGHSLGGAVSLCTALEHPAQVAGLALIAPLTHSVQEVPPVFRGLVIASPKMRRFIAWTLATPIGMLGGKAMLEQVFAPETPPADFRTKGGGMLGLRPKAFYTASTDLESVTEDLDPMPARYAELERRGLPIAMLYGRQDALLDWQVQGQAMLASLPSMQLELVDGGHMLPLTQPEQCAALIRTLAARTTAAKQPARESAAAQ